MGAILKSRWLWAAALLGALLALYAFLGFRVAPGLVRSQAVDYVRATYGRELQIGAVRIHPFKLQLEVRELVFPDRDRQAMLSFQRLFVDFEASSLWRRAYVFRDLVVEAPAVRAVLRRDGRLNLADLSPPAAAGMSQQASAPARLPALWIESLTISAGRAEYVEIAGRQQAFSTTFAPVGFSLKDFRTTPEGGAFRLAARADGGGQFDWSGRFALAPNLASQGDFTIAGLKAVDVAEFLGEALPFGLSGGLIELGGSYQVALGTALDLQLQLPRVAASGLGLRARGVDADWIAIDGIAVTDTVVALPEQSITVAGVSVTGLDVTAWLDPDGSVNLARMFARAPPVLASAPAPVPADVGVAMDAAPADAGATTADDGRPRRPWDLRLARLEVVDAAFAVEDRMQAPVKRWSFAPVTLRVDAASLDLAQPLPVSLDATINGHAMLSASGTLTPAPLSAQLDVALQRARLEILQPYILPVADLTIRSGVLGVAGQLRLEPPEADGPALRFDGGVTIEDFRSVDNALGEDLVSFRRLQLQELRFDRAPDALTIDRVSVRSPYARLIISPDAILNVSAVLDPAAAAGGGVAAAPSPPPSAAGLPIRIREVRIDDGRMSFSDFNVQPNFSAEIRQLNGSVTGLSSVFSAHAKVDLKGSVDEFSPVVIAGTIQPFAFDRFTDIGLKFENIALPVFNPYSGPLAGYNIAKGTLNTDLRYRIADRRLDASHQIRIDQLEWGEASANKGEATLPVRFATSLLKDRDGVINLDIPVTGTLDDPQLRIGPIVWQIIKNLIVKAVTAPFDLLGSLFAGAEDAQFVDFAVGDATLEAATAERLAALSKGLAQKPEVSLDIPIGALEPLDGPALAERRFLEERAAAIRRVTRRRDDDERPAPDFETLPPRQQVDVLQAVLEAQGGALPEVPEPPAPPAGTSRAEARTLAEAAAAEFLQAAARARVTPGDGDLAALARARAAAIQGALLTAGELEAARVFLVTDGKVSEQDGKVRLELRLK